MSREDTKKKSALDSMFEELENDKEDKHELDLKPKQVEDNSESKSAPSPKPKQTSKPKPKPKKTRAKKSKPKEVKVTNPIKFSNAPLTVNQNFRVAPEIKKLVSAMTEDENGDTIPGSKGFKKAFGTNAIIKEMVHLGALDESYLENLIPYKHEEEE